MMGYDYVNEMDRGKGVERVEVWKRDLVRVVFDDSDFEYAYFSGGMFLQLGDLVVTPRPSGAGRFGYRRYNQQGVATVVGFGPDRNYSGPYKTLVGRVVTGATGHRQKGEPKTRKTVGITERGHLRVGHLTYDLFDICQRLQKLEWRLDHDKHTHFSNKLPPTGLA